MGDWNSILSETAASPIQEHSFFRWIMGDVDDSSSGLKQLLQGIGPSEFQGNAGFDSTFGLETFAAGGSSSVTTSMNLSNISPSLAVSVFGFSQNNNNGRLGSLSNSSSLPNDNGPSIGSTNNTNPPNHIFCPCPNNLSLPISLPPSIFYQQQQKQFELDEEKPPVLNSQLLINQQLNHRTQNQAFFVPLPYTQQDQIPKMPCADLGQDIFLRRQQEFPHQMQFLPHNLQQRPTLVTNPNVGGEVAYQQNQQQAMVEQLFEAAELIEAGNLVDSQGILARLNHQLSQVGKPLERLAFYFKEALQLLLLTKNNAGSSLPQRTSAPLDVVLKINAYKAFSEVSPILQFTNFTCNQALLEALENYNCIHIIDFDIGFGGQWASFMQEISIRIGGILLLKITAFISPSSHNPLEISLTRENLIRFANDLGIPFEVNIVSFDSLHTLRVSESEAVAVNFLVGFSLNYPTCAPLLLHLVKQLQPKIVVSVNQGCYRIDLPFAHHVLHSLQSYSILLDSLNAVNVNSDTMKKIEEFFLQPKIESTVLGRHHSSEKIPPWRTLFASAGFSPLTFSNITETQAECLVKRFQVRGFHVEKQQISLVLSWQRQELASVSAWTC